MALVHKSNNQCKSCPAQDSCRQSALLTLSEIHRYMDMKDLLKHYADINDVPHGQSANTQQRKKALVTERVSLTTEQAILVRSLPVKPAKIAKTLMGRGVDLKASLRMRVNPFNNHLQVPCAMLMEGGFTKRELKSAMMAANRRWTERTAEGQVSVAFALLDGLDCLEQRNGRYQLKEH